MLNRARHAVRMAVTGRASPGRCAVCGHRTLFLSEGPNAREELRCARCWSIPRFRALSLVLDEQFPEWPSLRIHELAPGGAASDRLRRRAPAYTYSYFGKPDEPFEDVEALSFDDDSIDLFITQDVFEHVVRPAQGFAEIHRVLRPGGAHVFTVPVYPRPATVVRVAEDGSHLLEPAFHEGTEGPSLVVREWGSDLPEIVDRSGLETTVHRLVDRRRGLEGEHLEVIVSRKPRSPTA